MRQTTSQTASFYPMICVILYSKMRQMTVCFAVFYTMICYKPFYALLSTTPPPLTNPQITPSICEGNYSPLSSENHRSLFVKPAKRGKQRAGGEALFPSLHSMKWLGERLKGAGVSALFALYHFPFNYQPRHPHNCFTMQLGTSCVFDSPGLARNEPTPGKQ